MNDFKLYVITGEQFHPGRSLVEVMEQTILGGCDIIQLRDKHSPKRDVLAKAKALRELTRRYGVTFIVNDDIDIALAVDADGIHLGQDDLPLADARNIMGGKIIGISTQNIDEARQAEREGADYIGVGPVFETKSKDDAAAPVTTAYVRQVAEEIRIPAVAIGGIKLHNVDQVIEAGARRVCVISEIVGSADIQGTCRAFLAKLDAAQATDSAKPTGEYSQ
ncbi:MAG: thiE [Paenibacillus sp.]|jgi:thiamine-phosphate pyrophosphorylase|nr:thiE [Paenibacillus sp.]